MNEQKSILAHPLPLNKITPPYDKLVLSLQVLNIEIIGTTDSDIVEILELLMIPCLESWDTIRHWLIKLKWNTKHKIPGRRAHTQGTKPWGLLFCHLLELCIQCHALVGYKRAGYPDASEWFKQIWLEYLKTDLEFAFVIDFLCPVIFALNIEYNKTNQVAGMRQQLRKLKNYENPYNPTIQPHLHHLIECSRRLAESQDADVFKKEYWNPYLHAFAVCVIQRERNPKGYYRTHIVRREQQDEKSFLCSYESLGKGKGLKLILKKELSFKTHAPQGLQVMN